EERKRGSRAAAADGCADRISRVTAQGSRYRSRDKSPLGEFESTATAQRLQARRICGGAAHPYVASRRSVSHFPERAFADNGRSMSIRHWRKICLSQDSFFYN